MMTKNLARRVWRAPTISPLIIIAKFNAGYTPEKLKYQILDAESRLWILYQFTLGTPITRMYMRNTDHSLRKIYLGQFLRIIREVTTACEQCDRTWYDLYLKTLFARDRNNQYTCVFCNLQFASIDKTNYEMRKHVLLDHFNTSVRQFNILTENDINIRTIENKELIELSSHFS